VPISFSFLQMNLWGIFGWFHALAKHSFEQNGTRAHPPQNENLRAALK
jgi:hypothetical protein